MTTDFVDGFRQLAHELGSIPGELGIHPYTVSLVTKGWSGSDTGRGTATEVVTPITRANGQPPKVKEVSLRRVALGIGFEVGDMVVGPITPVSGIAWADLLQTALSAKSEALVRLTHTESGISTDYRIHHVARDKALSVTLTIKPVAAG